MAMRIRAALIGLKELLIIATEKEGMTLEERWGRERDVAEDGYGKCTLYKVWNF